MGFSKSRTNDFIMLCRKLKNLSLMKDQLESGDLGYTKARVLAPVVDKTNEKGWLDYAANNEATDKAAGQQPLIAVPKKRPAAVVPVRVSMEMSPTQYARYEKLWEQIRKQGGALADKVEALRESDRADQQG